MAEKYYPTIGLEIHAELKTETKMFCACKNPAGKSSTSDGAGDPEIPPNTFICPVCMAHPGALPVINKKAVENVIKVGLALEGEVANFTEFDRKNYFYPDIPKGYQISQYKYPIVSGGELKGVKITRVHLEEDTANNKHPEREQAPYGASDRGGYSLVDFNRAGIPLMELVTEPVIHSAEDAAAFARELQLIFRYLGVSDANMEKGEMRVEANISISPEENKFGTKVEVKNLNSFRSVERAIKYELERMQKLYEEGREGEIVQETRGWDEGKQQTFSQRSKESAHDYRYFPDPDLPKLKLHEAFDLKKMKKELPELPVEKRERYQKEFKIKEEDVEVFINDPELALWFEEVAKILNNKEKIKTASNYAVSDLLGLKKANKDIVLPSAKNFAELINLVLENKISSRAAKDILAIIVINDDSPLKIATNENMLQQSDKGALKEIAQRVVDANPKAMADYKAGKENAIMSLVGQIMKETKGSANPELAKKILLELLARP